MIDDTFHQTGASGHDMLFVVKEDIVSDGEKTYLQELIRRRMKRKNGSHLNQSIQVKTRFSVHSMAGSNHTQYQQEAKTAELLLRSSEPGC